MFTLYLLTLEQEFGAGTSLQSSCKHHSWNQEIASKLHGTMPKECIPGPTGTRRAFARKKGQQLFGSVKWKQPARTDVRASARSHVGKGFLKKSCGWNCREIIQNVVVCR